MGIICARPCISRSKSVGETYTYVPLECVFQNSAWTSIMWGRELGLFLSLCVKMRII